ncbi:MAG: class I SAM-dependent methyltransferase [Candidatus Sulfotelmatobacter sp.]
MSASHQAFEAEGKQPGGVPEAITGTVGNFPADPAICVARAGLTSTSIEGLFDTRFGIEGSFEVRRCPCCGWEQLSPIPAPAELKSLYERFYNFSGVRATLYATLRDCFFSSVLYRLWIRLDGDISFHTRRGSGRLLDIGCNEGRTLKNYARNGFRAEGTELNETAAAVARRAGFRVFTGPLDDLIPDAPYDVAVLSNVLEHSLDPKAMLLAARRLLNDDGEIWISCPNSQSWLRSVFGRWWINWHVPFHITHFSPLTLRRLLEESGFGHVEIRQITPALWVASSIVARLFARPGKPTRQLRNPFLIFGLVLACRVLLFPLFYWGNRRGRGDCLVATAAKSG